MAAVVYTNVMTFAENLLFLMDAVPEMVTTKAFLTGEMLLNPAWAAIPLNDDDKHDTLRRLTGMTVGLNSDLNCYPRGEAEIVCFDLDGNPVP